MAMSRNLKATLGMCLSKYENSSLAGVKEAVKFYNKNYPKIKQDCNDNSIICHIRKAGKRTKNIKKLLSIARTYDFIQCRNNLEKQDELSSCDEFKV